VKLDLHQQLLWLATQRYLAQTRGPILALRAWNVEPAPMRLTPIAVTVANYASDTQHEAYSLVEANFAALEARVLAWYAAAKDLHRARASMMYGVPYDQVTPQQREAGKRANAAELFRR
jgi:hypothetical protein